MPSLLHEGILELIRERPALVAQLLRDLLGVQVPHFTEARLTDASFTGPMPTEYRADAVMLLVDEQPVLGCIVEAQLTEDAQKQFGWPMYTVGARARYRCPFVLIVVIPDERVARWAKQPVDLGGGQIWAPLVLGPVGIPRHARKSALKHEPKRYFRFFKVVVSRSRTNFVNASSRSTRTSSISRWPAQAS